MKELFITTLALLYLSTFYIINSKLEKEFPIIMQKSPKDCGPVCLGMISKYYGLNVNLEEIKKYSSFDPVRGTSFLGLSEACDSIGIKNIAISVEYDRVLEFKNPMIAHWDNRHFVVVYKMTKDSAWVADPALGRMTYSKKSFCKSWTKGRESKNKELCLGRRICIRLFQSYSQVLFFI